MSPQPSAVPLRIGLVIDDSLDRPDGVQQYVLTLGTWLTAQGHHVSYLAPSTARTDLPHLAVMGRSVQVRFNGNRLCTPLPARPRLLRALLDTHRLDVINVTMPYSPFMSGRLVARAAATTAVVGTFLILPASAAVEQAARGLGLLQRRRLRRFDRVFSVSAPAQEFARRAFGLESDVVPIPVDIGAFGPPPSAVAQDPPSAVHIVFLGRLVERKGPAQLLAALAALRDRGPTSPFRVTIAGRGPLAVALEQQAASLGLADLVDFTGYVAEEDKAALLASGDLVVLPSTGGESFGISVVEALAAARGAVLVGDNPGYATVMGELADQLVDPTDTAAFASALARFVDDPELRRRSGERQRALAWQYDIDTVGPRIVEAYRQAVADRRS
ncbi:glycosyltransferase family 4 protein [Actinotalea sp.]|uniref:glycosyltransferase family 4 protein n=1 Tax=Actinotalea sp. TaxID=1872145 RepID=UPI00356A4A4C